MPFYAVRVGRKPGIYNSWEECRENTDRYSNAIFKKFDSRRQAEEFINGGDPVAVANFDAKNNCANEHVEVYTNGECMSSEREGAVCGLGIYWGPEHPWNVSSQLSGCETNDVAQIKAAERALAQAKTLGIKHVTIYTASLFVIQGITEWINVWKEGGWKFVTGHDVLHLLDFEALDRSRTGLCVHWKHVAGNQGRLGNREAQRLAIAAILELKLQLLQRFASDL